MVLLAPPPAPAGVEAAESVVAEGAGGGVLDKVPGMPAASIAEFLSSLKASERVLGPLSRVSKSSVVTSVCVKSSDMFTCERTLLSPTMGAKIWVTRRRYNSSIFCLCVLCADVKPKVAAVLDSVMSLPWLSTTATFSGVMRGTLEATK